MMLQVGMTEWLCFNHNCEIAVFTRCFTYFRESCMLIASRVCSSPILDSAIRSLSIYILTKDDVTGWNDWMAMFQSQLRNCFLYAMFHILSWVMHVDCFSGKFLSYFRLCYTFIVHPYTYKGWCYRLEWLNGYASITIAKSLSLLDVVKSIIRWVLTTWEMLLYIHWPSIY